MRKALATAALLSLAVAVPAAAQQAQTPNANWPWAHQPGTGESGPASGSASNIGPGDTRSDIAPHLPEPGQGQDGVPSGYLRDAQNAIARGQTGLAQQSLEMAETRLLDRSTLAGTGQDPDRNPKVEAVHRALAALGRHDPAAARASIEEALSMGPMRRAMPTGYAPPEGAEMPPPQGYQQPPPGYQQQPGYQQPPPGYAAPPPPPGYAPPPPPPPGYQ